LNDVKSYIAKDNPETAVRHIKKVISRIRKVLEYPYIGKRNAVYNQEDIREIAVEGYKVIYQIASMCINILVVYKNIDLDEGDIGVED